MAASDFRSRRSTGPGKPRSTSTGHSQQVSRARAQSQHHDDEIHTNEPVLLPQNEMAERALIGSALIDEEVLDTCAFVKPQYFFRQQNGAAWKTLLTLHAASSHVDNVTLAEALRADDLFDDAGSIDDVLAYGNGVPHSGHAKDYARIVCEKYVSRYSLTANASLAAAGYRGDMQEIASAWAYSQAEMNEVFSALGISPDGKSGPRFRLKNMPEVLSRPAPEWILPGLLQERKLWLLYGDSNTGKSFLALDMALCFATGMPWHGRPIQSGAVVYVAAEGVDGISTRVSAWLRWHKITGDIPNFYLIDESPNLLDSTDVAGIIAQINLTLDEPPVMVVFDTLAASMPGADENSSEGMGAALAALRQVQRECRTGVMVVHHSGKDRARGPRGHSSLRGAFDAALEVSVSEETGIISLCGDKARDTEKRSQQFAFRLKQIALDDFATVTSCVPEALDEPPPPDPRKVRRKPTASDKLYAFMAQLPQPLTHGELRRRFVDEIHLSGFSFDKALSHLQEQHLIDNTQGHWGIAPRNTGP